MIETPRLRLRHWQQSDREAFARMHADADVMRDYGGPIDESASHIKFDRYIGVWRAHGFGRWVVETHDRAFLGYVGLMPSAPGHPIGPHVEIGWRLVRHGWGHGYATEAAQAALKDAFSRVGLNEVLAYTADDNLRSKAVMHRLRMQRDPSRDFTLDHDGIKGWRGLVWATRAAA
jgi:RimJ/RimL family protein N-acetyltransferase